MYIPPLSRSEFQNRLAAAGRDANAALSLEPWLESIIVSHDPAPIEDEESLLIDWAYSLDAWLTPESSSAAARLARDYALILELKVSIQCLAALGEVALAADRLVEVGGRRLEGKLSDAAWEAFIANSRLAPTIRATIGRWSVMEISELVAVLQAADYQRVAVIFGALLCDDRWDAA